MTIYNRETMCIGVDLSLMGLLKWGLIFGHFHTAPKVLIIIQYDDLWILTGISLVYRSFWFTGMCSFQ